MKRIIGIAGTILVIVLVVALFAILGQPTLAPTVNTVIAAQLFGLLVISFSQHPAQG